MPLIVNNLTKRYATFLLNGVSFTLQPNRICGFIGRNGAGKTTTLKCLLNLVHPDSGEVKFFGLDYAQAEREIKQRVGYASGGVNFYPRKKLKDIVNVTARFYDNWDAKRFAGLSQRFRLDENKRLMDLSEGMKVKFNLACALSHGAELLILDEPTSGLDPVSREELLEEFMLLSQNGVSILFSTHIITDLEKCADDIVYLKNGNVVAASSVNDFQNNYLLVREYQATQQPVLGVCKGKTGDTALIYKEQKSAFADFQVTEVGLQDIMLHLEKEEL